MGMWDEWNYLGLGLDGLVVAVIVIVHGVDMLDDAPLRALASSHGMSRPIGHTHAVVSTLIPAELEPWLAVVVDDLVYWKCRSRSRVMVMSSSGAESDWIGHRFASPEMKMWDG
jgi:hypothetical protein